MTDDLIANLKERSKDETIVDELREFIARTHHPSCPRGLINACNCGHDEQGEQLLREAAARIEVALTALKQSDDRNARRALYALTI